MLKDKITVRVQTRFRALRKDHGTPFLEKCRRAREILAEIYQDRELCITENMIRRNNTLRGRRLWHTDEYYTEPFELQMLDSRLEALITGEELQAPATPPAPSETPPDAAEECAAEEPLHQPPEEPQTQDEEVVL